MGAWGEGPRETDTALDHELHVFGCQGRDDLGPQEPDEQRYIAWLVTQLKPGFLSLKEVVSHSLIRMRALLANDEWIGNWKNPAAVIKSIEAQIVELEKLLKLLSTQ